MKVFQNLRLKYKINIPALICLILLSVVLILTSSYFTDRLQSRTIPGERAIQTMRNQSTVLSSVLREYILTYDVSTLERIQKLRVDLRKGLQTVDDVLPEYAYLEELREAGENFVFASGKVLHVREQMNDLMNQMQEIENDGSEKWARTRKVFEDKLSHNPNFTRFQDTLADLGASAEFYHLAIMRSVWSVRTEADAELNPEERISWFHHPMRARDRFATTVAKVKEQMPELLEVDDNVTAFAEEFIAKGDLVVGNSVALWESIGELEQAERIFEEATNRAAAQSVADTNEVFVSGRSAMLVTLLGAMILLAVLMRMFAEHISSGLEDLVQGADHFGLSNLSYRVEDTRGDEVGDLARAFNRMADQLEKSIEELHKVEKEVIQKEREAAHEAGKAEVSTTILHNVGNVLNSVIISAQMVEDMVTGSSRLDVLKRANANLDELQDSLTSVGDRGKRLLAFYPRYYELLKKEDERILEYISRISAKVELIRDVVRSQQGFAKSGLQMEPGDLERVLEDALILEESGLTQFGIRVIKDYRPAPEVMLQRNKLTHILLNVLRNARHAMTGAERTLTLEVNSDENHAYIRVSDTGEGIAEEDLQKIFQHGYTTKADGHGFGLHGSANSMAEMRGRMWAESGGTGKGATFVLEFPLKNKFPAQLPVETSDQKQAVAGD